MSHVGVIARLRAHQSTLWIVALLWYGVGDLLTTTVGLSQQGLAESGPVAAPVVDAYGALGLVVLKSGLLAGGYAAWRVVPGPHRIGIPLGLAIVGFVVTTWNTALIWIVVS